MSRLVVSCSALVLLTGAFGPGTNQSSYGYQRDKDPLLLGTKRVFSALKKRDLPKVRSALAALHWQVVELASPKDLNVRIGPRLEGAAQSGETRRIVRELLDLVHLAMAQKFHWNLVESLSRYGPARARLKAAEYYYVQIFSGNVKKLDTRRQTHRHQEIMAAFAGARRALGSPGLFGSGRRPPQPDRFRDRAVRILAVLRSVYPHLTRVRM